MKNITHLNTFLVVLGFETIVSLCFAATAGKNSLKNKIFLTRKNHVNECESSVLIIKTLHSDVIKIALLSPHSL